MKVELQCGDTITIPEGCKAIVKDGSVVFEKEEKEFKDGDILVTVVNGKRHNAFIYKNTDNVGYHNYYVGVNNDRRLDINNDLNSKWCNSDLAYATEEEKQLLFDKMKEQHLRWNAEEKRVEKYRWRANMNEYYYFVSAIGTICKSVVKNGMVLTSLERYNFFNQFRTYEQTKEAARRVKETLQKYHEEIGE